MIREYDKREVITAFGELALLYLSGGMYKQAQRCIDQAFELDRARCCGIIESRYNDDQPRNENGRWTSGGGSSGVGDSNNPEQNERPIDSSGVPYNRPQLWLPKNEYAHVMGEINTRYDSNFKGKRIGFIDLSIDEGYFSYRFEIHGYNEYNIFDKEGF